MGLELGFCNLKGRRQVGTGDDDAVAGGLDGLELREVVRHGCRPKRRRRRRRKVMGSAPVLVPHAAATAPGRSPDARARRGVPEMRRRRGVAGESAEDEGAKRVGCAGVAVTD